MITEYHRSNRATLLLGDAAKAIDSMLSGSINCIVTSPPYYALRDYGSPDQYGLESTPEEFIQNLRGVFAEARRVLASDGTLWINIGDSYNSYPGNRGAGGKISRNADRGRPMVPKGYGLVDKSLPNKSLLGIPWRLAMALQADGWVLRSEIVWSKPNAIPTTSRDRPAGRHEHIFLFSKGQKYWFDREALGADGDVWTLATGKNRGEHLASFPVELPARCIGAGCVPGGVVLDPFSGTGTTGVASIRSGRSYVGVDVNVSYHDTAIARLNAEESQVGLF